jgi:hypothetical protein
LFGLGVEEPAEQDSRGEFFGLGIRAQAFDGGVERLPHKGDAILARAVAEIFHDPQNARQERPDPSYPGLHRGRRHRS